MGNAIEITTDNFEEKIVKNEGVALVDFSATWCGPCQALAPTIEELAAEYGDKGVIVGKCDVDDQSELAARFGVMSVPTVIFFKNGEQQDSIMGNQPKTTLEQKIKNLLG